MGFAKILGDALIEGVVSVVFLQVSSDVKAVEALGPPSLNPNQ